ncbi:rRNA maturation RNase YbeY [Kangiella shandongensis]|uniref:rRNA maturation RNase YbeY n=1 Tax=Kangiella shandongensis TaxID=2763258 RepID=UPI001CBA7D33|nr:rRNA maturation RNase YbeY [Kangiella shandongensis]
MSELDLELQVACEATELPSEAQFTTWLNTALQHLNEEQITAVTVRIISADESQSLNHQYRGKDRPTNVLSFPFELPQGLPQELMPEERILGDLAICAEVVAAEAEQQEKALFDHWAHMTIHGCLHLLGYDHINDDEAEVMEAIEVAILAQLGIDDPYHIED